MTNQEANQILKVIEELISMLDKNENRLKISVITGKLKKQVYPK